MENKTADIIREALMEYELCNMHILGDEDSNLPLVDLLTPEGESDITWGKEHIDRITDLIMEKLGDTASQQCAELQKRIELLERDLIQETGKCMKYQHEIATSPLQSENESLKKLLGDIRFELYARDTDDAILHKIGELLEANGFPYEQED